MTIDASMFELARTGSLGPLRHGMSHRQLRDALGPPPGGSEIAPAARHGSRRPLERERILQYGDVEFHFDNWVVRLIFSDHENLTDGGPTLKIDPWIIRRGLPYQELEQNLKCAGIEFAGARPDFDPDQRWLTTGSGVVFSFLNEPDAWGQSGLVSWWTQPAE